MATAAEYMAWAGDLDRIAGGLGDGGAPLVAAWTAGPVVGGTLALVVGRAVEAAADHVAEARSALWTLADVCRQRAVAAALTMDGPQ